LSARQNTFWYIADCARISTQRASATTVLQSSIGKADLNTFFIKYRAAITTAHRTLKAT